MDDGRINISWRGDAAFVAVNSIITVVEPDLSRELVRRVIRVYNREGDLDSVSEPVDGQEEFLSWRPSGNLVASVQRIFDGEKRGLNIIFFERNGLRHGEFDSRLLSDTKILDLKWNMQSSVLAILLPDRVQLWTMNNYYWYLKQEVYLLDGSAIDNMQWHSERPLTLILCRHDIIELHEFVWSLFDGTNQRPNDCGVVMVADGTDLKLTPFAIANTPPPMSFRDLKLGAPLVHATTSPSNELIAALEHKVIEFARWLLTPPRKAPEVVKSVLLYDIDNGGLARQIRFVTEDVLAVLFDHESFSRLHLLKLDHNLQYEHVFSEDYDRSIVTMVPGSDSKTLCFETADGQAYQISVDDSDTILTAEKITMLPERCTVIAQAPPTGETGNAPIVFGLASNGRLYANSQRLSVSCTSFILTDSHLAFTTAQNLLKFVHLSLGTSGELDVPADGAVNAADERCRAVERGAKIVSIVPSKLAIVLQMPRGNLETIYPRLLVLEGVRRNIDNQDYKQAFQSCRVHRVNLDILYDYNPKLFMDNVESFVDQLEKVEYIDLFLSGLTSKDVTTTTYKETLPSATTIAKSAATAETNKVNTVCDAILEVLQRKYFRTHVQSIITAFVCKDPPDIETALKLISEFDQDDSDRLMSAIEHICFLQDVNRLYDYALGLYDLRLALILARQSQKDPREYLPFIENLQKMTPLRRNFTLDCHLGRYSKAIVHLADLKLDGNGNDVFDELVEFMVKHELYKDALQIYKYEPTKTYAILRAYAHFLRDKSEFKEAGLAFETLGDFQDALDAYTLGLYWQEALAVCGLSETLAPQTKDVAAKLAEALYEARRYKEAATVLLEYSFDLTNAVRALCKGYFYEEAIRIVLAQNEAMILSDIVDSALVDGFNQISELLSDCRGQLSSQLARLRELRVKKVADPMAYFEGAEDSNVPDNVSIAGSVTTTSASVFTLYTGKTGGTAQTGATRRTAKNRRREERKRAKGKKGSIYEEEYLMNSIRRLLERINETRAEARRLVECLVRRGMRERAMEIQRRFGEIVEGLDACVEKVFKLSEEDRRVFDDNGDVYLLPEMPVPVVDKFEKLQILDYE
ncbi:IKI3 family-domain-containing protein [Limtongia smithiae]|uniref:IKI3 family-domain-containing protein n=1 Tax=Limtongia smithiae TaxID=1125753 RepID=UPI0034CD6139